MGIKDSHFSCEEGPQGIAAICVHTLNDTNAIFPWRQSPKHSLCDNQALTFDGWVLAASDIPWVRREDLASDPSLSSPLAGSVPTASPILGGWGVSAPWGSEEGSRGSAFLNLSSQHFTQLHQLPLLSLQPSLRAWQNKAMIRVRRACWPQETLAINLFQ